MGAYRHIFYRLMFLPSYVLIERLRIMFLPSYVLNLVESVQNQLFEDPEVSSLRILEPGNITEPAIVRTPEPGNIAEPTICMAHI